MKLMARLRGRRDSSSGSETQPAGSGRDRSRSLCVDRLASLLRPPPALVTRDVSLQQALQRRRASSAISSTHDLISRRGVFSRRHYGSVELLPQIEANGHELQGRRFRVENGESLGEREEMFGSPSTPVLENPEYQTRWYFKYFLGKLHQNYVGSDSEKVPFFLSVVLTDANNQCVPQYRVILWRKTGSQKISLAYSPNKPTTVKQILCNFSCVEKLDKGPREIFTPDLQKDLLLLEEQEGSVNFKFGVLYTKPGQSTDDEMLSNEFGSDDFNRFINLLGDQVRLRGWDKYRGGLDVKGDMTGKYSIYTMYEGHEIMFHISTMLPYSKENRQQVERKRHIGNDIVNIVFLDGGSGHMCHFNPSYIKSQFTHVFALVTYNSLEDSYRLAIYSEESVPLFGPSLPCPPVFYDHEEFREFLLVKLINGEKAAFNTPTFAQKRERTLDMLIKDLYSEHMIEGRGTMLNRRAFSDVLPDAPRGSRRKEEARQVEFVRAGQALKLDTIMRGDAPTSLASSSMFKRPPWEPACFYPDFPHETFCGDSWGDNKLIAATEAGVFVIEESTSHRLIFDKTVPVKQLSVIEAHGILLLRAEKGRECKIHVFRLSDFDGEGGPPLPARNRNDLKDFRLERTRGCTLYATSRPGGSHLRVVAALQKKLLIMQWRHSAAWTAWCPASDTDTVEGFQYIREIPLSEHPSLMTFVDGGLMPSTETNICLGYRHQFDLVNEHSGEYKHLHTVESSRAHLVAAIDLYEDEEPELLLCYNHTCHFQKLVPGKSTTDYDFRWNAIPSAIVCAFPYIFAFTTDAMEIRLIINGNLVQTTVMPKLHFICAKNDIYFATTAPEFFHNKDAQVHVDAPENDPAVGATESPSTSPDARPFRLFRIPMQTLSGAIPPCGRRCPTPCDPGSSSASSSGARGLVVPGAEGSSAQRQPLQNEHARGLSRSCSSSPTPHQPSFLAPPK
ncbi:GTPase-activating Rap/Ran-GAP domain-like protein 3 [Schistocerca cancellata]|uniref:GTPase-activating Rap/Ran-GAP domain-like protein 3 n=1 Tax=Schistocerca cancellata TaxID=274614 RepID=UPI0021195020|nr:GTPase-activating Rap/Ran-GAP domain-like protein 3 [Schistocerca cancellata]